MDRAVVAGSSTGHRRWRRTPAPARVRPPQALSPSLTRLCLVPCHNTQTWVQGLTMLFIVLEGFSTEQMTFDLSLSRAEIFQRTELEERWSWDTHGKTARPLSDHPSPCPMPAAQSTLPGRMALLPGATRLGGCLPLCVGRPITLGGMENPFLFLALLTPAPEGTKTVCPPRP